MLIKNSKSRLIKLSWFAVAVLLTSYAETSQAFTLDDVATQAKKLAENNYKPQKSNLPTQLRELDYSQYQTIKFKDDKSYWLSRNTPFHLQFYHLGSYFNTPVKINEVTANSVHEIKYSPDYFTFGKVPHDDKTLSHLGFAGFKVLYPINNKRHQDEITSFLGASYFRVIGRGQVYGLSARGLAIDTGLPSGEEFPHFTEFWVERPNAGDNFLTLYALLDSPRATGAYRFILRPGNDTIIDVKSRLFLRDKVGKLGIAPLTSMYLFGSNQPSTITNYHQQLHDSDGLSIHNGNGEWIWRPLNNPRRLAISTYQLTNPKGFGLLQRNRNFDSYQDLDAGYEKRPSGWVEPVGQWGKGQIELVEIPTNDETNDNIVAFWTPEQQPKPGEAFDYNYRLHFTNRDNRLMDPALGIVSQTLRSDGDITLTSLSRQNNGIITFMVDFTGKNLSKMANKATFNPQISVNENTETVSQTLRYNPNTQGVRLTLQIKVKDPKKVSELRAALATGGKTITETWSYQLAANE